MDLFRTRRLVGGMTTRILTCLVSLLGTIFDNRLLFLDKETIQETEMKKKEVCLTHIPLHKSKPIKVEYAKRCNIKVKQLCM